MARIRSFFTTVLIVCIAGLGMPLPVHAAMVGTDAAVISAVTSPQHASILGMLDRADVRAQLEARGVHPDEVKSRVAALTDDEAAEIAARIDELPAGGVLGFILLVFVILLITDILGLTKVFPFTRPVR